MILVTGGTGLVGSHLLYELALKGQKVRALYRNDKRLSKVKHVFSYYSDDPKTLFNRIEWVLGDITDVPKLQSAFEGITHVYHCAALISFQPNDYYKMRHVNITGTANVVNLCLQFKIEKLCYVSSIAAIGSSKTNQAVTEEQDWESDKQVSAYALTKYGGEMEVWRGTQEGLAAVMVNPGVIIGPGYWKSGSGTLFTIIKRGLKYHPTGRTGFVDVKDVVSAMTGLMSSNISIERFILISENAEWKRVLTEMAVGLEAKIPRHRASDFKLNIARWADAIRSFLLKKQRRVTKSSMRAMASRTIYDGSKITNTLGLKYQPLSDSIASNCRFFLSDQTKT